MIIYIFILLENVSRNPSSLYTERRLEGSFADNDTVIEASDEKAVTLFPIVTSLTPHEDKNENNGRKGYFFIFVIFEYDFVVDYFHFLSKNCIKEIIQYPFIIYFQNSLNIISYFMHQLTFFGIFLKSW